MARGERGFRCVPTSRVKEFVESYMAANYPIDDCRDDNKKRQGIEQFCFDARIPQRRLLAIRKEEMPNVEFDTLDRMLTSLEMQYLWYVDKEDGGFADYFLPDVPPAPVEPNEEQARIRLEANSKRKSRATKIREAA